MLGADVLLEELAGEELDDLLVAEERVEVIIVGNVAQ